MAVLLMTAQAFRSDSWPAGAPVIGPAALRPAAVRLAAADLADGWLARQVARAAGSFEHGLLGRAPTGVTVVGTGSWMVVHLHEQFSPLERQLAAAGESGARRVCDYHHGLFHRTAEALCEHVRLATGVELAAAIAHIDAATGSVLKTLTTGAEVAQVDAPATPVQLAKAEALASELVDLGPSLPEEPWLGARPCVADMLPLIGAAPRHRGLWLHLGHAHQGFTLGPASARLLAELVAGVAPYVDPTPYSPARWG
jgi:glycine/D-amino acid oxidase-like deaminating enzyme